MKTKVRAVFSVVAITAAVLVFAAESGSVDWGWRTHFRQPCVLTSLLAE